MKISQKEARRLRKRVHDLETEINQQRNAWTRDYPGGVVIGTITREPDWFGGAVQMARKLGHAVVVTIADRKEFTFYALPIGKP